MFVEWLAATQEPLLNGQKKMKEEKATETSSPFQV